mmetsp:Transcript_27999/g.58850  ORF Transcript_27999/g.58850 Transcript_27999/m.58850 type:complete len:262 (+) Transcript_27999:161-946(+)
MASASSVASSTLRILSRKWNFHATSSLSLASSSLSRRSFSISATFPTFQESTGDAPSTATPYAQTLQSHDTPCPPWQNPLHHENPSHTRVFAEEFSPSEDVPLAPLPPVYSRNDAGENVNADGVVDGVLAPPHVHQLAVEIAQLSMREVVMLMERIGGHFGFEGGDGLDGGYEEEKGGTEEAAGEEAKEEQTAFDLKLAGFDAKSKIKVIKEIRGITNLGLKEAKELVEGAPTVIKKGIKKEEAEELKAKLEAVGATIEIA